MLALSCGHRDAARGAAGVAPVGFGIGQRGEHRVIGGQLHRRQRSGLVRRAGRALAAAREGEGQRESGDGEGPEHQSTLR